MADEQGTGTGTAVATRTGPGRPSKFTPEVREKVLAAVAQGMHRSTAAAYAGISLSTLNKYLAIGASADAPPEYEQFLAEVLQREAQSEMTDIMRINKAAQDGEWRAAAWKAERRHPERWGRTDRTQVEVAAAEGSVQMGGAIIIDTGLISSLAETLARRNVDSFEPDDIVDADLVEEDADEGGGTRSGSEISDPSAVYETDDEPW